MSGWQWMQLCFFLVKLNMGKRNLKLSFTYSLNRFYLQKPKIPPWSIIQRWRAKRHLALQAQKKIPPKNTRQSSSKNKVDPLFSPSLSRGQKTHLRAQHRTINIFARRRCFVSSLYARRAIFNGPGMVHARGDGRRCPDAPGGPLFTPAFSVSDFPPQSRRIIL